MMETPFVKSLQLSVSSERELGSGFTEAHLLLLSFEFMEEEEEERLGLSYRELHKINLTNSRSPHILIIDEAAAPLQSLLFVRVRALNFRLQILYCI